MDTRRILTWGLMLSYGVSTLAFAAAHDVPEGYREVAMRHGVPPESLYSLALAETSMAPKTMSSVTRGAGQLPTVERPWPWTINVAGKGYRYASRLQAWEALQGFLKKYSRKRIDVGIAQINLGWNGHRFTSTWEAFDPWLNLNAAATILRECYDRKPGSWLAAAGCYHHPAGGAPATRYQSIVKTKLARINGLATAPKLKTPAQTVTLTWIEPRSQ
ncbi:transglycosylase SLT domain-containing protein [Erwinia oleae]|uniref:transglycosylase SLT domain-containing protein n=1 Tax=Erwinia oleae TaxID=796334 RepID=UPI000558EA38|nr:transglycosylase SLT domain-containing protein [Erwinia oleae]